MNVKESAQKRLEEILNFLNIKAKLLFKESENTLNIKIETEDSGLLIGFQGETLKALQHVLRILVLKELDGERGQLIVLDVGNYREQEEEKLKNYIKKVAEIVKTSGRSEALPPMSSYKRRLVHLAVLEIPGVSSESFGEAGERRIIIKPGQKSEE